MLLEHLAARRDEGESGNDFASRRDGDGQIGEFRTETQLGTSARGGTEYAAWLACRIAEPKGSVYLLARSESGVRPQRLIDSPGMVGIVLAPGQPYSGGSKGEEEHEADAETASRYQDKLRSLRKS
jgi:hypothetical protein